MICLFVIFFLLMLLNSGWDSWLIADGIEINHTKSTFVWVVVYLAFVGGAYLFNWLPWASIWPVLAVWPSVRWIGHDFFLNVLRAKKWDYLDLGIVASKSDKFLRDLPFHFIWLKLAFLLGCVGVDVLLIRFL